MSLHSLKDTRFVVLSKDDFTRARSALLTNYSRLPRQEEFKSKNERCELLNEIAYRAAKTSKDNSGIEQVEKIAKMLVNVADDIPMDVVMVKIDEMNLGEDVKNVIKDITEKKDFVPPEEPAEEEEKEEEPTGPSNWKELVKDTGIAGPSLEGTTKQYEDIETLKGRLGDNELPILEAIEVYYDDTNVTGCNFYYKGDSSGMKHQGKKEGEDIKNEKFTLEDGEYLVKVGGKFSNDACHKLIFETSKGRRFS